MGWCRRATGSCIACCPATTSARPTAGSPSIEGREDPLIEIVPDGMGGFIERPAALASERMIPGRPSMTAASSHTETHRPTAGAAARPRALTHGRRLFVLQAGPRGRRSRRGSKGRAAAASGRATPGHDSCSTAPRRSRRRSRSTTPHASRFDLPNTALGARRRVASTCKRGGVDTIVAAEANGRTRLVFNLDPLQCHIRPASKATTSS